jgi:hypothetical protein
VFLYTGSQHKVAYISLFVRMRRDHRVSIFFNDSSFVFTDVLSQQPTSQQGSTAEHINKNIKGR